MGSGRFVTSLGFRPRTFLPRLIAFAVACGILLGLCACASADEDAAKVQIGSISIILPDGCIPEPDSAKAGPIELGGRELERESAGIALASNPEQTLMAVSSYEGASFDEAIAYVRQSSEGSFADQAQRSQERWNSMLERYGVEDQAPDITIEYGEMEFLEVDGHRAARQDRLERLGDGTVRAEVIWECIDIDANAIGILYVRLSEEGYQRYEPLLDELISSIQIAS